ncbi:Aminoalkylphosphonate N-acetyltransferase [Dyadobacter sp. CECT 9275]|uniref:Aminoalkylphosphonate N-acetyltransferase n=1 Tax=Dyadobacter helix TaxID=2822344 RepID=A0A916JB60_9BACT|nr:GNAT family N-acetyltransferase [Dyadobacter sp. CECT 9275]CAG4999226.1 Aminoalkylphosphonate N-acetyltransferase [Dyadobacter sp. CECT 9275]
MRELDLSIRPATDKDADILYTMICGLENKVMDRMNFDFVFLRNIRNDAIRYYIAEYGQQPVGMGSCHIQALLHHAALVGEIQEMYVEEAFRSKAIGKMLMGYLVDFAKSKGAIQLEVTSRNYRESAHRFYQREGFEKSHVKLVRYF